MPVMVSQQGIDMRRRNTKIIATLGPASCPPAKIESLFQAGADVFRLNFSHGTHIEHRTCLYHIRRLEKRLDRPIGVIVDLQGLKFRIGTFTKGSIWLKPGDHLRLDRSPEKGTQKRVQLPHPEIFDAVKKDMYILLDDARIRLRVTDCRPSSIDTEVIHGGELSDHKGVHVPDISIEKSGLTEKDRADFEFGLDMGADWIALSYVQTAREVKNVRDMCAGNVHLLTKIENARAVSNLSDIIDASDAVMIARGDLGIEMAPEIIPIQQKRIIGICRERGTPVVVATQMLDSMVRVPLPTRAEASDVATAVYEGADGVTLSAETAVGDYPIESVEMMERLLCSVEGDAHYRKTIADWHPPTRPSVSDAISTAASNAAENLNARAIITYTKSGSTARLSARERPGRPILGLSVERTTARQLTMVWGVHSVNTSEVLSFSDMVEKACRIALKEKIADVGDLLVITAGVPFGITGSTNIMRIVKVEQHHISQPPLEG